MWEALDLFASYYKKSVPPEPLLEELGLAEKRGARFSKLSGGQKQRLFIALALAAIFLLSWKQPSGGSASGIGWIFLSVLVFMMWGVQAYVMKFASSTMKAESIFMYMAITAVLLIPTEPRGVAGPQRGVHPALRPQPPPPAGEAEDRFAALAMTAR